MTKDEKVLLENALDSLDRLYDCVSTVTDIHALMFATSKALAGSRYHSFFEPFIDELHLIVRSGDSLEVRREKALIATDELRGLLADSLPFP